MPTVALERLGAAKKGPQSPPARAVTIVPDGGQEAFRGPRVCVFAAGALDSRQRGASFRHQCRLRRGANFGPGSVPDNSVVLLSLPGQRPPVPEGGPSRIPYLINKCVKI